MGTAVAQSPSTDVTRPCAPTVTDQPTFGTVSPLITREKVTVRAETGIGGAVPQGTPAAHAYATPPLSSTRVLQSCPCSTPARSRTERAIVSAPLASGTPTGATVAGEVSTGPVAAGTVSPVGGAALLAPLTTGSGGTVTPAPVEPEAPPLPVEPGTRRPRRTSTTRASRRSR